MRRFRKDDRVMLEATGAKGTVRYQVDDHDLRLCVWWDQGSEGWVRKDRLSLIQRAGTDIAVGDTVTHRGGDKRGEVMSLFEDGFNALIASVTWTDGTKSAVHVGMLVKVSGPSWNDVQVGDKVTFRVTETGEEFTATATGGKRDYLFLVGAWIESSLVAERWTLLSITKPAKPLPTKPGSVIRVKGVNGLVHRREHKRVSHLPWVTDAGTFLDEIEIEDAGWEEA